MNIRQEIKSLANQEKAKFLQKYFKTQPGEYGEGDIFLGLTVPEARKIAIKYKDLPLKEIQHLLDSKIHEERLIALEILTHNYEKSKSEKSKEEIVKFYLSNTKFINNWDLVDTSAPYILGNFLSNKDKSILYALAKSQDVWERRIAIVSTYTFIKNNQFKGTLAISEILLQDKHDLIQKAVGWMLREIGKKDKKILELFLKKYYKKMPRTMLRYAIEKFPEKQRKKYLKGKV